MISNPIRFQTNRWQATPSPSAVFSFPDVRGTIMDEVWFITFQFSTGGGVTVCSNEHACKTAYDEWTDYRHAEFKEESKLIEIEGHEDSPCREYRKVGIDAESIIEATVGKY